jgi:glycosyltransferase involved in cell wall biosynthesis
MGMIDCTVVIPTFNRIESTVNAINSICTGDNEIEIIIVDDASDSPFMCRNDNVQCFHLKQNSGPGIARREGVARARTNLIAFLDSDDRYELNWPIKSLTQFSSLNLDNLLIVGDCVNPSVIMRVVKRVLNNSNPIIHTMLIRLITCIFNPIYIQSIVISRKLCCFADNMRYCEDYFTTSYAVFNTDNILFVRDFAFSFGRKPKSKGGLTSNHVKMLEGELMVKKWILLNNKLPLLYRMVSIFGIIYSLLRSIPMLNSKAIYNIVHTLKHYKVEF